MFLEASVGVCEGQLLAHGINISCKRDDLKLRDTVRTHNG